jgi:flagellar assembly protein FliH
LPETSFVPLGTRPADATPAAPVAFRPVVLDALTERVAAHDEARTAGFAAGYGAGFAAGAREAAAVAARETERVAAERAAAADRASAQVAHALDVLAAAASAAQARTAPVLDDAEALLHAGALDLARAVLGSELADDERSATAALSRVLRHPQLPDAVTVRLHPRDLDALRTLGADDVPSGVLLVADPTLSPGDAVAQHPDGYLDARIGTALDRAAAALADGADGGTR